MVFQSDEKWITGVVAADAGAAGISARAITPSRLGMVVGRMLFSPHQRWFGSETPEPAAWGAIQPLQVLARHVNCRQCPWTGGTPSGAGHVDGLLPAIVSGITGRLSARAGPAAAQETDTPRSRN
ncbi:hypothetical protein Adi01nite_35550 [Amorphoplanes digitatis]|nr:hypothetical protein Adi01nite_35550 [Actinoplanes digitatis]